MKQLKSQLKMLWTWFWGKTAIDEQAVEALTKVKKETKRRVRRVKEESKDIKKAVKQVKKQAEGVVDAAKGSKTKGRKSTKTKIDKK